MNKSAQIEMLTMLEENAYQSLTGRVVGVDEVGRGPLIGDVVAAAVILPSNCDLPLRDSKKISESKREVLAEQIKEQAVAYAIEIASPEEVDELNILHATMLAMQRAVNKLASFGQQIDLVYVDGNRCPKIGQACQSVVKGDDKIMEISAASILAKVYRDKQMLALHDEFPEYGFAQHKGYPTAKHLENLRRFGMIPGYRKSFKPVKALIDYVD